MCVLLLTVGTVMLSRDFGSCADIIVRLEYFLDLKKHFFHILKFLNSGRVLHLMACVVFPVDLFVFKLRKFFIKCLFITSDVPVIFGGQFSIILITFWLENLTGRGT